MLLAKWIVPVALVAAGLLAGCENDDSPMQPGDCTITMVNATRSAIHVEYQTQKWDVLWPAIDVSHEATLDIQPGHDAALSVHFDNELGTSRIKVTKDAIRKHYDMKFGRQTLTVKDEDFAGH